MRNDVIINGKISCFDKINPKFKDSFIEAMCSMTCEMERPHNPFRPGIAHDVMEMALQGEFDRLPGTSDLTVTEIAEVLCTPKESVSKAIVAIKKKTGYIVPYVKMEKGRKRVVW